MLALLIVADPSDRELIAGDPRRSSYSAPSAYRHCGEPRTMQSTGFRLRCLRWRCLPSGLLRRVECRGSAQNGGVGRAPSAWTGRFGTDGGDRDRSSCDRCWCYVGGLASAAASENALARSIFRCGRPRRRVGRRRIAVRRSDRVLALLCVDSGGACRSGQTRRRRWLRAEPSLPVGIRAMLAYHGGVNFGPQFAAPGVVSRCNPSR